MGLMEFDLVVFVLEFFFQYLLFENLPLVFSENAAVAFLSYFDLLISYLDCWAAGTFPA